MINNYSYQKYFKDNKKLFYLSCSLFAISIFLLILVSDQKAILPIAQSLVAGFVILLFDVFFINYKREEKEFNKNKTAKLHLYDSFRQFGGFLKNDVFFHMLRTSKSKTERQLPKDNTSFKEWVNEWKSWGLYVAPSDKWAVTIQNGQPVELLWAYKLGDIERELHTKLQLLIDAAITAKNYTLQSDLIELRENTSVWSYLEYLVICFESKPMSEETLESKLAKEKDFDKVVSLLHQIDKLFEKEFPGENMI